MTTQPYQIIWNDDIPNVLNFVLESGMTWEIYHEGVTQLMEKAHETSERIDILVLVNAPMPAGNPIPHLRRVMSEFTKLDNLGLVISVDPTMTRRLTKMYSDIVIKLFNPRKASRFPFMASYDDAVSKIKANRADETA